MGPYNIARRTGLRRNNGAVVAGQETPATLATAGKQLIGRRLIMPSRKLMSVVNSIPIRKRVNGVRKSCEMPAKIRARS